MYKFHRLAQSCDLVCYDFVSFGKDVIKTHRLGTPDSFIQVALQAAFYK